MKYEPKTLEENVNVSNKTPIRDLFSLLGTLLVIIIVIYILLGLLVGVVVTRLPRDMESKIGNFLAKDLIDSENSYHDHNTQELLNELITLYTDEDLEYTVHIFPEEEENAFALVGGHIVLYTGLLNSVESENELVFILAHELGHLENRDHLRGFGRRLVLLAFSAALMGRNSDITYTLLSTLDNVDTKFSQKQETAADKFALRLLFRKYGHVEGALDFFQRHNDKEDKHKISYFFSSHPHPEARIKNIENYIEQQGYGYGERKQLNIIIK